MHVVEANSLAWQGLVALMDGDWARGAPLIARAADLVRAHDLDRLATSAMCVTAIALLQAARGSKNDARVTLGAARRLTGQVRQIAPWFAVAGPLIQARVALLLGDTGLARALFAEARGHMGADLAGTVLEDFLTATQTLLHDARVEGIVPDTLTPAELRVLQYLPSRLTFPEIAAHLFVSQNTIKTHALAIYRKLGTTSRNEAVDRARALGLVESPSGRLTSRRPRFSSGSEDDPARAPLGTIEEQGRGGCHGNAGTGWLGTPRDAGRRPARPQSKPSTPHQPSYPPTTWARTWPA